MSDNAKTFKISAGTDGQPSKIDIKITEVPGVKAENLGLKTWGAAYILANQIHQLKQYVPDAKNDKLIRVLEIGAGTGLTGLAAALIWRSDVTITDLPTIIPGMQANIDLNADAIRTAHSKARCGTLDWFNPDHLAGSDQHGSYTYKANEDKFQVILAADTLYDESHPRLMADTIFHWLARTPEACFIVCYAQRIAYLDHIRELWTLLEQGGLQSIHEGTQVGDESWDEEAPFEWAVFRWKELLS